MTTINNNDVLSALLGADDSVEKDVFMTRFDVNFRIQAVNMTQIKKLKMQATHVIGKTEVLDEETFAALLIAESVVNVDWRNPKLLAKYNTSEAVEVVKGRLLSGEIASLSAEIMDVSGFNLDVRIAQIKN